MFGQTDDTHVRNALHGQPDTERPFPTTFNIRKKKNIEQQKKELELIAKKQEEAQKMAKNLPLSPKSDANIIDDLDILEKNPLYLSNQKFKFSSIASDDENEYVSQVQGLSKFTNDENTLELKAVIVHKVR